MSLIKYVLNNEIYSNIFAVGIFASAAAAVIFADSIFAAAAAAAAALPFLIAIFDCHF